MTDEDPEGVQVPDGDQAPEGVEGSEGEDEPEEGDDEPRLFPGDVKHDPNRFPRGTLYGWLPDPAVDPESGEAQHLLPMTFKLPWLHGKLEDNSFDVLLLDVTITVWNLGQADITAAAALTGTDLLSYLTDGEVPAFVGATMQVTNLDAICGFRPLAKTKFPGSSPAQTSDETKTDQEQQVAEWGAVANDKSNQTWSDDDAELTLGFRTEYSVFDPYHFRVAFTPIVEIGVATGITLRDWIDRWADPLKRIVSVATGREEVITHLSLNLEGGRDQDFSAQVQVWGSGITQEPYSSRQRAINEANSTFIIPQDHSSLLDLIRTWCRQLDDHNPILETYNPVMLRDTQHPRARYLTLVPCLEGLYGYQNRSEFEKKSKDRIETREKLLTRLKCLVENKEVEFDSKDLNFVKNNISKRPPSDLSVALRRLFHQVDADSLLDRLKSTNLVVEVDKGYGHDGQIGRSLSQIRNDLAHGNRGYPAGDLAEVSDILHRIVRAQILRTLDVSQEAQKRALRM